MKKIASCLLALALLVTLTACSGKSDNLSDGTDTSGTVSDTVKDTEKGTETAPAETTGESDTVGTETNTEQPTSDSKVTAPAKDTTSAANPPATDSLATNPPKQESAPAVKTCNHTNTEVRNKKDATTSAEGYTGDNYCKDGGKLISSGSAIPKIKKTYTATHDYYDIEMEIFRLINDERAKNGVAQLVWDEELYPGTKIRAQEYPQTWSHTRPNGEKFVTAIIENSNYTMADFYCWGENLNSSRGYSTASDVAKDLFTEWYDSPGHRANMLDAGFTHTTISVVSVGYLYYSSANIFIGK